MYISVIVQKTIKIITEGGQNFGFGHVVRCKALYDAFTSLGHFTQMLIHGDESLMSILQNVDYLFIDWHNNNTEIFSICKKTDICIIDSYNAQESFYREISQNTKELAYFDDTNRILYPKGSTLINGILNVDNNQYKNQKDIALLLDIQYQCVRSEFWNNQPKIINKSIKNIFITVGGNDIRNSIPKLVTLCKGIIPNCFINIAIGSSSKNLDEILSFKIDSRINIAINSSAQEIHSLMNNSDLAISAAGQTLCELACCGVPGISFSVIDNQTEHAKAWDYKNCFDYAGQWDNPRLSETIKSIIIYNKNTEIRQFKSQNMQRIIDGNGSKRIAEYLLSKIN